MLSFGGLPKKNKTQNTYLQLVKHLWRPACDGIPGWPHSGKVVPKCEHGWYVLYVLGDLNKKSPKLKCPTYIYIIIHIYIYDIIHIIYNIYYILYIYYIWYYIYIISYIFYIIYIIYYMYYIISIIYIIYIISIIYIIYIIYILYIIYYMLYIIYYIL